MKIPKILTIAALALASAALLESHASAQTVSASVGDLVLGFDVVGGANPGGTQDYEVDLGSFSTYAAAGYTNSNITPLNADLTSLFGVNYGSRTDLEFSIAGTNGTLSTEKTLYIATPGSDGPPANSANQANGASDLNSYTQALNGKASTTNNPEATAAFSNSTANGFTKALNGTGGNAYGAANLTGYAVQPVSTSGSTQTDTAELYSVANGNSGAINDVGAFSFNSATGVLSFQSAVAVPEPSAYALGICAVLLFIVLRRRSSVA